MNYEKWYEIRHLNDLFVKRMLADTIERNSELEKIEEKLIDRNIVGVIGKPGIGKTILAIQYIKRKCKLYDGNKYDDVYFVNCSSEESLKKSFYIDNINNEKSISDYIESIIDKDRKYLFVFDYVFLNEDVMSFDECMTLDKYIMNLMQTISDECKNIDIIYTTSSKLNIVNHNYMEVKELNDNEIREYLENVSFYCADEDIDRIINTTKHPCVIKSIKEYGCQYKDYNKIENLYCAYSSIKHMNDVINDTIKILEKTSYGKIFKIVLQICSLFKVDMEYNLVVDIINRMNIDTNKIQYSISKYKNILSILEIKDHKICIDNEYKEFISYYYIDSHIRKKIVSTVVDILNENINVYDFKDYNQYEYINRYYDFIYSIVKNHLINNIDLYKILTNVNYYMYNAKYYKYIDNYIKSYNDYSDDYILFNRLYYINMMYKDNYKDKDFEYILDKLKDIKEIEIKSILEDRIIEILKERNNI